jgi:SAM-dependent methyltransferase
MIIGKEIDLLVNYPSAKRNLMERANQKSEADRAIARQFGKEFFDGDRRHGYGGFNYNARFWEQVVPTFQEYWSIEPSQKLLDVGCAKGFMLFDFQRLIPGLSVSGCDISKYAIDNALESVKSNLRVANANKLPYQNNSYDFVISINTVHNLELNDCKEAIREIQRVSRGKSFITVDAYRNADEKERMYAWNLTAKTILSVDEWKALFLEVGYTGDFFWFIP